VEDRDRVAGLVGRRVEAAIVGEEEGSGAAGLVATLEEVRDDGIVLSGISELGPGPTLFCPWESLRRVRGLRPWFTVPYEEPPSDEATRDREYYELYEMTEVSEEKVPPMPPEEDRPSARTLDRVVPIGQRQEVGEVVVALTSLELFEGNLGVLRYRISYGAGMFEGGFGIPEPELVIRDESDRELSWSPRGSGGSDSEADGEVEVRDLPESGELEVEVTRLASLVFDEEAGEEVAQDTYDGLWTFRFPI
jgi:hypothetical protein